MIDEKMVEAGYVMILDGMEIDWQKDPHMKDTPRRAAKAFVNELCVGLWADPPDMTTFPVEAERAGMVISRHIPVRSLCAHHLLPFIGEAAVGYIPREKILGLSKLTRAVDYMSRRPQVQEKLTDDIADFIWETLVEPLGVAVLIRSRHMCMECRGVEHISDVVTSTLYGEFEKPEVRAEFLSLAEANGK